MGTWRAADNPAGFVEGEWFYGLHLRSTSSRNRDGHGVAVEALRGPALEGADRRTRSLSPRGGPSPGEAAGGHEMLSSLLVVLEADADHKFEADPNEAARWVSKKASPTLEEVGEDVRDEKADRRAHSLPPRRHVSSLPIVLEVDENFESDHSSLSRLSMTNLDNPLDTEGIDLVDL